MTARRATLASVREIVVGLRAVIEVAQLVGVPAEETLAKIREALTAWDAELAAEEAPRP